MLTADRILALIDPSVSAPRSLDQALLLADQCGATVHILPFPHQEPSPDLEAFRDRIVRLADERMRHVGATPDITVPSTGFDLRPPMTEVLLRYAQTHDIDLIVADTPDDRGAIPALASAPVRALAEDSDVPLFVVGHRTESTPFRRILAPTDFSDHARSALRHAQELAALYGASLDVLHVLERPQYVALNATDMLALGDATITQRKAQRRLDTLVADLEPPAVPVQTHLRHGDAADQICHFVDEHPVDLIVLSTHGVISRSHHRLGNVADKVLRRVTCPVFLIPAFGRSLVPAATS